jgi:hypothetical protein
VALLRDPVDSGALTPQPNSFNHAVPSHLMQASRESTRALASHDLPTAEVTSTTTNAGQ